MTTIYTGAYDDLCTYLRATTRAKAAMLIVQGGSRGSGFSLEVLPEHEEMYAHLPEILETIAAQMRLDASTQPSPARNGA